MQELRDILESDVIDDKKLRELSSQGKCPYLIYIIESLILFSINIKDVQMKKAIGVLFGRFAFYLIDIFKNRII